MSNKMKISTERAIELAGELFYAGLHDGAEIISALVNERDELTEQLAKVQADIDEINFISDVQQNEIERLRIRLIRDTVPDTAMVQHQREEDAECYSKARIHLCDRIEELHTKLSSAKSEIEEWRGKHDVACLTITKLQKQYEGQLAATSKAMEASVELEALRQRVAEVCVEFVKSGPYLKDIQ